MQNAELGVPVPDNGDALRSSLEPDAGHVASDRHDAYSSLRQDRQPRGERAHGPPRGVEVAGDRLANLVAATSAAVSLCVALSALRAQNTELDQRQEQSEG